MRIACPSCNAEYDVPDTLAAGRSVRCARCAAQWTPIPPPSPPITPPEPEPKPVPEPGPEPGPDPEPEPPTRQPLAAPPDRAPSRAPAPALRNPALTAAWLASAVVLTAAIAATVVYRAPIMAAWPPSIRLFAALGMGPA